MNTDKNEVAQRESQLVQVGHNVVNLHPSWIKYDLMTDSWTELLSTEMTERMDYLRSNVDFSDPENHSASVFPFAHFLNVAQGRSAEAFFWKVGGRKNAKVVQNMLFPTTRQHLVMNRMTPVECAVVHTFDKKSTDLFRGNLDCSRLRDLIKEDEKHVAYVYIEAENNAAGGYPVSMSNVKEIRQIVDDHDIKMVLDATRLMENCVMIQRFESGYSDKSLHEIVQEFCSYFDSMTCSLAKDFGTDRGGIIATNDERLYYRAKDHISIFGSGINATDKAMINAAMKGWEFIENMAKRRVDQVSHIHDRLTANGLPVLSPSAGHCIVLDVAEYMAVEQYKNPTISFIAKIYSETGIRGGRHLSGIVEENRKINYVRFAIPLCMQDESIDAMTVALVSVLQRIVDLPDMLKTSSVPGITGMLYAQYEPVYKNPEQDKLQASA